MLLWEKLKYAGGRVMSWFEDPTVTITHCSVYFDSEDRRILRDRIAETLTEEDI